MPVGSLWDQLDAQLEKEIPTHGLRSGLQLIESAVLGSSSSSLLEDLEVLAFGSLVAGAYEETQRGLSWVDEFERRRGAELVMSGFSGVCGLVRLGLAITARNHPLIEECHKQIDLDALPRTEWILDMRLALASHLHDKEMLLDLLRRPARVHPFDSRPLSPARLGGRLWELGYFFLRQGRLGRAISCLRAALKRLRTAPGIRARLKAVAVMHRLSWALSSMGSLDDADQLNSEAMVEAFALRHERSQCMLRRVKAEFHALRGDYKRAEETLLASVAGPLVRRPQDSNRFMQRIHIYLDLINLSLDQERVDEAAHRLKAAERLFRRHRHARTEAYLHVARGRLLVLKSRNAQCKEALEHFDAAERSFREGNALTELSLSTLSLYRSQAHLSLKDLRAAIAGISRYEEFSKRKDAWSMPTYVHLKSRLILEPEIPQPQVHYSDVIENLGWVRNPIIRFKVLSNLYMYSWDLQEVELTAHHLNQVNRLAGVIEPATFHDLYAEHITGRVMRRAAERMFGIKPLN